MQLIITIILLALSLVSVVYADLPSCPNMRPGEPIIGTPVAAPVNFPAYTYRLNGYPGWYISKFEANAGVAFSSYYFSGVDSLESDDLKSNAMTCSLYASKGFFSSTYKFKFISPLKPCDDEDIKNYAYCTYIIASPDNVSKYVKIVDDLGTSKTLCMNNQMKPLAYTNEQLQNGALSVGKHTVAFYQCDSIDCNNSKSLAADYFTVTPDHKVDHNKLGITLDLDYGANCDVNIDLNNAIKLTNLSTCSRIKTTGFDKGYKSVDRFECAWFQDDNARAINKYVKIVSGDGISFTYCVNQDSTIAYHPKLKVKGVAFYQCDTVECNQQQALRSKTISGGDATEEEMSLYKLDSAFGSDCTISPIP